MKKEEDCWETYGEDIVEKPRNRSPFLVSCPGCTEVWTCRTGDKCIPIDWVLDEYNDCEDRSDEGFVLEIFSKALGIFLHRSVLCYERVAGQS